MYNTMNNPSAHPSYSHYYLLSPSTLFFVFFFCTSYCFFCTSHCLLHISLSFAHLIVFCTSYCFALFYFIAHFILISPFLTICMPLCYVTYIICILIVLHCHWVDLTWFDCISLLVMPCITIMWQIKKPWTLNLEISTGFQQDLCQGSLTGNSKPSTICCSIILCQSFFFFAC